LIKNSQPIKCQKTTVGGFLTHPVSIYLMNIQQEHKVLATVKHHIETMTAVSSVLCSIVISTIGYFIVYCCISVFSANGLSQVVLVSSCHATHSSRGPRSLQTSV